MTHHIGLYLFDDVEVLDFAGPLEVFYTAARMAARQEPNEPPAFQTHLIADRLRPVQARAGLTVQSAYGIDNHPRLDVLVVPGGVVTAEMQRPEIIAWIQRIALESEIIASVCTGAFLLAQAGLLRGQPATTHWEDMNELKAMFPDIRTCPGTSWVDVGRVVTAAGISAGIEMSLHLVARLHSPELARRTARQMEYTWRSLE